MRFTTGFCLLMSSVTFAASAQDRDGGGSGYNGPDLIPVAIQNSETQGLTRDSLLVAARRCMLSADGRVGLLEDFAERVSPRIEKYKTEKSWLFEWKGSDRKYRVRYSINLYQMNSFEPFPYYVDEPEPFNGSEVQGPLFLQIDSREHGLEGVWKGWTSDYNNTILRSALPFPLIVPTQRIFQPKKTEVTASDAFGSAKSVKERPELTAYQNISIRVPTSYIGHEAEFAAVNMVNAQTQIPSDFAVNFRDYVECLRTEIPRLPLTTLELR